MTSRKKPHGSSSTTRAQIDELLDESLNETIPENESIAINTEPNPDDRDIVAILRTIRSTG